MLLSQFTDNIMDGLHYPIFNLGKVEFSSLFIIKMLLAIIILSWVSKLFKKFLVNKVLIRYNEDIGVRQAMGTIARYIFFVFGLFIVVQSSGIDLSGLAIIGGALGVGIGFGLQNITNNFVSGVVILLERPVKVGDRIEVSSTTGDVVRISPRATTVVTNDGIAVIIPNSELISTRVTNWSFTGKMVRFKSIIPVPYGTDQDLVIKILLEIAAEDKNVLENPAPTVRLREFADSSLNFELVFWTSSLMHRQGVMKSRINLAANKKLAQHNISIPFPQLDLHVKENSNKS